jgi:O-methyltransferase
MIQNAKNAAKAILRRVGAMPPDSLIDFDPAALAMCRAVKPFTMTSKERLFALREAVLYVVRADIPGDIVECGVWKGGSMMAAAMTLIEVGARRKLHLFDTFEGMPKPGEHDISAKGIDAATTWASTPQWALGTLDEVTANICGTGYDPALVSFVQGKVEDTIPASAPQQIALLRLDTDWYESTAHELEHLYPRLSTGGVLIIDDYGHWKGARRAVDEYIAAKRLKILLNRIDYTGRIAVKL